MTLLMLALYVAAAFFAAVTVGRLLVENSHFYEGDGLFIVPMAFFAGVFWPVTVVLLVLWYFILIGVEK